MVQQKQSSSWKEHLPVGILFLFAFLLYGNTLTFDYTLDDVMVIGDNAFTKKGFAGIADIFTYDSFTGFFGKEKNLVAGGRYRPLSIASFAVEHGILGENNPAVSHFFNVLCYAFTGIMIFLCFSRLQKRKQGQSAYLGFPFILALLFIAHPLHTEVVANIKGRDELFSLLFSLLSLLYSVKYTERPKATYLILSTIFLFMGLLSKENSILFILVIPMTLFFFNKSTLPKLMVPTGFLLLAGLVFLGIRGAVLGSQFSAEIPGELLNNPFIGATTSQKAGTILYSLGLYLKLLVFPHPLTHDYYPWHIPIVPFNSLKSLVPLMIYSGLIVYAIVAFRRKSILSYGILVYLVTLSIVSNILFSIGTTMNERFIYIPSLGFCIVLAWLLSVTLRSRIRSEALYFQLTGAVLAVLILGYSVRTVFRNLAWKDNFTLFTTDVLVSHESTKCNTSAGGKYIEKALLETDPSARTADLKKAIKHLEKALEIYPDNKNSLLLLGNAKVLDEKDYKGALTLYLKVLKSDPLNTNANANAIKVLTMMDYSKDAGYMFTVSQTMFSLNPDDGQLNAILGRLYGRYKQNPDSAVFYLEKAAKVLPGDPAVIKDLGISYAMQGNYEKALSVFNEALQLIPGDEDLKQNIAITKKQLSSNNHN